jgi:hypothetical protein
MAKALLPAAVENRLKAQVEFRHRLAREEGEREAVRPAPFITISRQFGCNACALAEALAERLRAENPAWDFTMYDRRIIEALTASEPVTANILASLSERTRGVDANDPDLYHLILNNRLLTRDEQVEAIVGLVRRRYGELTAKAD